MRDGHRVTQVFCSALPVSYGVRSPHWEPLARLVLEACYEATLLAAAERPGAPVLLTRVGAERSAMTTHGSTTLWSARLRWCPTPGSTSGWSAAGRSIPRSPSWPRTGEIS